MIDEERTVASAYILSFGNFDECILFWFFSTVAVTCMFISIEIVVGPALSNAWERVHGTDAGSA